MQRARAGRLGAAGRRHGLEDLHTADVGGELLGQAVPASHGFVEAINAAAWAGGVLVDVPAGVTLEEPIRLRIVAGRAGSVTLPRVLVRGGRRVPWRRSWRATCTVTTPTARCWASREILVGAVRPRSATAWCSAGHRESRATSPCGPGSQRAATLQLVLAELRRRDDQGRRRRRAGRRGRPGRDVRRGAWAPARSRSTTTPSTSTRRRTPAPTSTSRWR